MAERTDGDALRAAWMQHQGLTTTDGTAPWIHAIGGVDLYLSARCRGTKRGDVDRSASTDRTRVVPSARGCTMLVPRTDVPTARQLGAALHRKRADREMERLGVKPAELKRLAGSVLEALADGPMDTRGLRDALPPKRIRSLGDAGKKLGHSTTLPVTLRNLEGEGKVRRSPQGGRVDDEGYEWTIDDTEGGLVPPDDVAVSVAGTYFDWSGPATRKDFAAWSGLTQRDARAAIEKLELLPFDCEESGETYFTLPDQADVLRSPASPPPIVLLPFRDPYLDARSTVHPLVSPEHLELEVSSWGSSGKKLGEVKSLHHRSVILDGRVAGLWEYDPESERVECATFDSLPKRLRKPLREQCDALSEFLRDEFGHAKIYPMDAAKNQASRLQAVRDLASS